VAIYAFYKNKPEQPCQLSHLIERSFLLLFPTVYPSEYPPIWTSLLVRILKVITIDAYNYPIQ